MSRLWRTDHRTDVGKWKINQFSGRPETAIYQREQNKSAELRNQLDNLCLSFLNGLNVSSHIPRLGKVANKEKQEKQYKLECLKVYNCASGSQWIVEGQAIYICICCYCKRPKFFGLVFVSRTLSFWKTAIAIFLLTKCVIRRSYWGLRWNQLGHW